MTPPPLPTFQGLLWPSLGRGGVLVEAKFLGRAMRVTAALSPDFRVLLFLLSFPQQISPHLGPPPLHLPGRQGRKWGSGSLLEHRATFPGSQHSDNQERGCSQGPEHRQPEGVVKVLLVPAGGCASTPGAPGALREAHPSKSLSLEPLRSHLPSQTPRG